MIFGLGWSFPTWMSTCDAPPPASAGVESVGKPVARKHPWIRAVPRHGGKNVFQKMALLKEIGHAVSVRVGIIGRRTAIPGVGEIALPANFQRAGSPHKYLHPVRRDLLGALRKPGLALPRRPPPNRWPRISV